MSECDHTIALDGHEFSLWDQRAECPYCHIAELEQENERLREAAESLLDSVKPRFDLQHNKIVPDFSLDKLREALEAGDE